MVATDVEEETGCVVAYVAFSPRRDYGDGGQPPCPVTVSAVHFPPAMAGAPSEAPRVKDLDLFSSIVPSVVKNSMSYDSLTGGCVFLATSGLLGGATVRFPSIASASQGADLSGGEGGKTVGLMDESLLHDETVVTIKSHLQSAFRQYLAKMKEGGSSNPAREVIPPSIGTCSSQVLSAAVVLASRDYACASAAGGGIASSSPFKGNSPVTVLRNKLRHHKDFVNFLAHAGAYRKVSTAGRVMLRDYGEIL